MADETPKATPETPEVEAKKPQTEFHVAKKGVIDAGEIVTSAGGEKIFGTIADITDGDR